MSAPAKLSRLPHVVSPNASYPSRAACPSRWLAGVLLSLVLWTCAGCYVPLRSYATPAATLSDEFRTPVRSSAPRLNLASLTILPPQDHVLAPGDVLLVLIPGMFDRGEVIPLTAPVAPDGTVALPLIEPVSVAGGSVPRAQQLIDQAYSEGGILVNARVNVQLAEKAKVTVTVVGEVTKPGVYEIDRFQADVMDAIGSAEGFTVNAAEIVEIHRRLNAQDRVELARLYPELGPALHQNVQIEEIEPRTEGPPPPDEALVLRVPLRGGPPTLDVSGQICVIKPLSLNDVQLRSGDVIMVPRRRDEVFFVVGLLNRTNVVNFSVREQDRQLGNAFLLPNDRDIDVVTAVAMAGYIDPIDSPSTVTVHRQRLNGPPLLVRVDLIAARYDWRENIYVQPGDIIYLNPDAPWWMRRTFDRILPALLTIPYDQGMQRWINPFQFN